MRIGCSLVCLELVAAPGVHEQLLVAGDGLLLEFGSGAWDLHELDDADLDVHGVQVLSAEGEEPGELSQVEARNSLDSVVGVFEQLNQHLDQVEVLLLVEEEEVLLPKLLGVDGSPAEGLLVDLLAELVDGGEHLVVLVEVGEQLLKQLLDLRVNPVSVLQLSDDLDGIDVGHDLEAFIVLLDVVEEQQDDSHDLLLAEVVQHLRHSLEDLQSAVFEAAAAEGVEGDDPESVDHVVGNLVVLDALVVQVAAEELEAALVNELLSQLVGLHEVHDRKGVGVQRDVGLFLLLDQPVQELLSLHLAVLVLVSSN